MTIFNWGRTVKMNGPKMVRSIINFYITLCNIMCLWGGGSLSSTLQKAVHINYYPFSNRENKTLRGKLIVWKNDTETCFSHLYTQSIETGSYWFGIISMTHVAYITFLSLHIHNEQHTQSSATIYLINEVINFFPKELIPF